SPSDGRAGRRSPWVEAAVLPSAFLGSPVGERRAHTPQSRLGYLRVRVRSYGLESSAHILSRVVRPHPGTSSEAEEHRRAPGWPAGCRWMVPAIGPSWSAPASLP